MSFVSKQPKRLLEPVEVAKVCVNVAKERGLPEVAAVLAVMCIAQESDFWCPANNADPSSLNYPHDSVSNDGRSVGYFQQQNRVAGENPAPSDNWWGSMASRMDLRSSCAAFMSRLRNIAGATGPSAATTIIANVQNCREDLRDAYAKHWDRAWSLVRGAGGASVPDNRPAFNEFAIWSPNNQDRNGTKIDLFLLHTQEGGGGNAAAENLANWLANPANQVSYHYTISQASDGGVTVVDCVDTDDASWSVLDANNRSINLCFAGSKASWTRDDWMKQANAIDVAAYLAVQDCRKYGIPIQFIGTGGSYTNQRAGIADHQYVTQVLKVGTHVDVGIGFPKDVFNLAIAKYASQSPPPPAPPPAQVDRLKDLIAELQAVLKKYGG